MKYRGPGTKPETGMEMTTTLSLPAGLDTQHSAEVLIRFLEGVRRLSAETGATWVRIHCVGIPPEFEARIEAALAGLGQAKPQLQLVVDNTRSEG